MPGDEEMNAESLSYIELDPSPGKKIMQITHE